MQAGARESVHPWQFGLVVLAAVTPLVPSTQWAWAPGGVLACVYATAAVVAVPLFLHSRPSGFGWSAGFVAALLLPWSFIGAMAGMLVFFPSVLQLLLAAGADPRRRPRAATAMLGAGLVLSVLVLVPA
ncbi:hypothetical protein ACIGFK_25880 [Streptomyces sp. NPDC085524]|uniref:hypothetical protein n=1 Tax=unclassified Streptomyces TaxID=2593676 RepID=UPI0035E284C3